MDDLAGFIGMAAANECFKVDDIPGSDLVSYVDTAVDLMADVVDFLEMDAGIVDLLVTAEGIGGLERIVLEVVEDTEDFSGISTGFTDATAGFIEDARFLVLDISGTSTDFLMDVEAGFTDVTGTSVTFMDFVTDSSLTGAEVADTEAVDTEVGFDIVTGLIVAEAGFIDTAGTSVIFLELTQQH